MASSLARSSPNLKPNSPPRIPRRSRKRRTLSASARCSVRIRPRRRCRIPDFFNLQLLQRIEADLPRERARAERPALFWPLSRLAWAGAFCLLVAFGLFKATIPTAADAGEKSPYFAQVIESWPGADTISATTVYNPRDNVTVLWLEGLDYLPGSQQLQ